MKTIGYLNFDGNCRDAMKFYAKCLGAELMMMPFSEAPGDFPKEAKDRVMHSKLDKGGETLLMASDTAPGMPFKPGTNFAVSVHCESQPEIDGVFGRFSEGGKVTMPLQDTFWGARFGMLTDRFGVNWMFNYEKPKG
jgi:PhnB protein